ncbi:MAG: TetR/AcrR family transcriptional regulator [Phyllobacterium sp.]
MIEPVGSKNLFCDGGEGLRMASDMTDECKACRPPRLAAGQDPVKRKQILDGARRIFSQMGFDAASMNDITREAGVSKGTIYVYFQNKEELFEALCEDVRAVLFADIIHSLENREGFRDALISFGVKLVGLIASEEAIRVQRTVIGVAERMPHLGQTFYDNGPRKGQDLLKTILGRKVEAGELAIDDTELAAFQLFDLFQSGIYRRRLFGSMAHPPSEERLTYTVTQAVDVFLRAYAVNR